MQGVGVVGAGDDQTGPPQPGRQPAGPVDADVAAFVAVVLVGQGPADALGQPPRDGHRHRPARAQDPHELGHGRLVGGDVLEDLCRDHPVEGAVGERHRQGVAAHDAATRVGRSLARFVHALQDGGRPFELVPVAVEGDDAGAPPVGLEGVTPSAAAQVQQAVAGAHAQPAEVDGEHQRVARMYRPCGADATDPRRQR